MKENKINKIIKIKIKNFLAGKLLLLPYNNPQKIEEKKPKRKLTIEISDDENEEEQPSKKIKSKETEFVPFIKDEIIEVCFYFIFINFSSFFFSVSF